MRPTRQSTGRGLRAWRTGALAALALTALVAPTTGAVGDVGPTLLAAPGAWLTQYATPVLATSLDIPLFFRNEDVMRHDVVSDAYGPDGGSWCEDAPAGRCPLFATPLIARGVTARVEGVDNAVAPGAYDFYCTLHTAMRGTLVVAPSTLE